MTSKFAQISFALSLSAVIGLAAAHPAVAQTGYTIQQITPYTPPPGYTTAHASVFAYGLNNHGQVVGQCYYSKRVKVRRWWRTYYQYRAFLWQNGVSVSLGTLPTTRDSTATDINDAGTVVGYCVTNTAVPNRAFVWSKGVMTALPTTLRPASEPAAINNAGIIVGKEYFSNAQSGMPDTNHLPVAWANGQEINLGGSVPCIGAATGINNLGQIIGWCNWFINGHFLGGSWIFHDLSQFNDDDNPPPFISKYGTFNDINDNSVIVGYTGSKGAYGNYSATMWSNGVQTVLDPMPWYQAHSEALGVNNSGAVVGYKDFGSGSRATLWQNGAEIDLNTLLPANSGWVLMFAYDINESGQIVGYGKYNGLYRGFLLTPPSNPTLTSLGPNVAAMGSPDINITVNGKNFVNGAVVYWNGEPRATTFVSATQLQVNIPASDLAFAGNASVTVSHPNGAVSNAVPFLIAAPVPTVTDISPNSAVEGGPDFLLTVNGSDFVPGAVVRWKGQDRPTTYVSPSQLVALIPASDIALAGAARVTVFNPAPGGGISNGATFTITASGGGGTAVAVGQPSNIDEIAGTFDFEELTSFSGFTWDGGIVHIVTNGSTVFKDPNGNVISKAEFFWYVFDGADVRVQGTYNAGTITATEAQAL